ncbi:phosphopentomutase [Aidingimonas halophila]|uniref:Phosphopentomutase n=1 Tax=Aidingimonas halophila TaxID=574349 RepID=A0A1H3E7U2_9GAMM|nr:phosphopentomutase [Aidingimonas halophila]GHC33950.1 phosphopentomutase [Aidingimonas halophila]SDX74751.1 phosphopentomutase [Aidingimonas halophila]
MTRAIVLVLDSFGIGAGPDADRFGDQGADTLGHIASACAHGQVDQERQGPLSLPNLARLGLFHAHHDSTGHWAEGVTPPVATIGAYGHASEISSGKDTPSGHWELAGVPVRFEWGYFESKENSFPADLLDALVRDAELPGVLGNCHASGTDIIARLGEDHLTSGKPIVYTSADSVFQIAAHENAFGLERLYRVCEVARRLLEPYNIGRVIARPFVGDDADSFARTGNRRDYSVEPPTPTVLQKLANAGGNVVSVGKIADIYAHCGITHAVKASGHEALFDATLAEVDAAHDNTLIMTNFVDFDMVYGHRRDVAGYAAALEAFDTRLPELLDRLGSDDLLIITADHGCDPTWSGTDHTREQVPVLTLGGGLLPGALGARATFADVGQTLASYFGLPPMADGDSFLAHPSQPA